MPVKKSAVQTIYHVNDGPVSVYDIDARHALKFRDQWSETPWEKDGKPAKPVVEIPAGWEDGTSRERIDLAMKLGAPRKGLTAAHADEVVLKEVERRAEEPAEEHETRPTPGPMQADRNAAERVRQAERDRIAASGRTEAEAATANAEVDRRRFEADRPRIDETAAKAEAARRAEAERRRVEGGA